MALQSRRNFGNYQVVRLIGEGAFGEVYLAENRHLERRAAIKVLRPVLALTATATPDVARDICKAFGIAGERHVQTSFRRKNLHLRVTPCAANEKLGVLTKRLASAKVRPAVDVLAGGTAVISGLTR